MSNISKLKREHSLTLVAFHQTLGVHMLKHAKIRDKEQHEMKIRKRTKDRPRAIQYNHQTEHLIIGSSTIHLTTIAKKATTKSPNITREKVKLDGDVILT